MKKVNCSSIFLCFLLMILTTQVSAQDKSLPPLDMPSLEYKPDVKKGWVGQFVYQLKFNDSTGGGKGKDRVYYHIIIDRTNSGFVELTSEVRGAIRSNQPDKNNVQRYESWIGSGTKKSWSKHDEIDTVITPVGVNGSLAIVGRLDKYSRYTSADKWVQGWITNTDLQIDYTTGKYSFAIPIANYNIEGDETMVEYTFKLEKKDVRNRKENRTFNSSGASYLSFGEWNIVEGSFKEGQKEITIRERIPVTLDQSHNDKKLPPKKGLIDFFMVLKKIG
ncbi:MAG: hypothetical protein EAZ17_02555 [Sphingobacteriales bacterium]|nr:MAG: hypothetical protein EAZ17_02555 [Sphingobacteriales bacterium]